jgi:23S rRNA (uracil1939-C5)-methyltransferase
MTAQAAKPMAGELLIHELGPKGDGIHRGARERIYIDRALPGDVVRANLRRGEDGLLRGELIEIVAPSPQRVAAPCPHYEVCGGCTLQHARDDFYRDWKIAIVREALRKKGLDSACWGAPVFLPPGTRRRATFAALKKNGRVTLGYFRRRSHRIAAIDRCLIVDPAILALRDRLVSALRPILAEEKEADIFVQRVGGQSEIVITGPVGRHGKPDLPVREAIARLAHEAEIGRIAWRKSAKEPGEDAELIVERAPLRAHFGALEVALPPYAFLQPTPSGEAALVAAVMAALPAQGKFADLFCGCGTFTGPMLERGAVDAYDGSESAIRALRKAKTDRVLKAMRRDLFREPLTREEANRYDAIVFDPPRAGAAEQARALAAAKTPLLIAVSCNPATFARDARLLADGGYRLESVTVIDQFTWSHHVELVAAFRK